MYHLLQQKKEKREKSLVYALGRHKNLVTNSDAESYLAIKTSQICSFYLSIYKGMSSFEKMLVTKKISPPQIPTIFGLTCQSIGVHQLDKSFMVKKKPWRGRQNFHGALRGRRGPPACLGACRDTG